MKIQQLLNAAGANQLRKLKAPDLKKTYKQISKALKGRTKTFRKHGREEAVPERFRDGLESPEDMSKNEMLSHITDALRYMNDKESSYRGWHEKQMGRMKAYNETMEASGQPTFDSEEDFDRYGRFMGDMQDRFGELWHYNSDQAKEMYAQAERLNLDVSQLTKNFDFWADHLEELAEADPITWHRAGRPVYASDYARKLGLGRIMKK